jgi:hypothetical protein
MTLYTGDRLSASPRLMTPPIHTVPLLGLFDLDLTRNRCPNLRLSQDKIYARQLLRCFLEFDGSEAGENFSRKNIVHAESELGDDLDGKRTLGTDHLYLLQHSLSRD